MKAATLFMIFTVAVLWLSCGNQTRLVKNDNSNNRAADENVYVSDIILQDKPLDVIQKHVNNIKWHLLYRKGGITGDAKTMYEGTYLTFTNDHIVRIDSGEVTQHPLKWVRQRDIYTGDSTWVVSGVAQWKIEGIYNDTLRIADNFYDGFGYALIRAK